MSELDKQVGGSHYQDFAIQPLEFITKNKLSYIQGNIIKYVVRFSQKNGTEDLDKAIHYINILKEVSREKKI
jgi:hypothetical protein